MTSPALERVAAVLRQEGGLLAGALRGGGPVVDDDDPRLGALAASGPRAVGCAEDVAVAVEAAYEGHLLHRGRSRLLDTGDRDLALLAGDRLYALSLETLAEAGEVAAVRELADVISLCAQAAADGAPELESAAWEAGASAIGWGPSDDLADAKAAARAGDSRASEGLLDAARVLRGDAARAG